MQFRLPENVSRKLSEAYDNFRLIQTDLETFFDVQIIYLEPTAKGFRILDTRMIQKSVCFVHKLTKHKSRKKLLYGSVNFNSLSSNQPIEVSNVQFLTKFLGYDFILDESDENFISVEHYKLQIHKTKLKGFYSNSVPGQCVKWETKLRIGVLEDKFFWIPSKNLVMKRFYCNRDDCMMSFQCESHCQRHQSICSREQKVKTKQIAYGDKRDELEQIIKYGYLPQKFENFRATQMAVFDIECLESKLHTASPEYGACVLANQVICSIGRCIEHIELNQCDRCIYRCVFKYWSLRRKVFRTQIVVR